MLSAMKKLFSPNPKKILGIDIGSNEIKIAEIDKKNKPVLRNMVSVDVAFDIADEGSASVTEEIAKQIRRALNTHGFTAKHAVLAVSGRNVFVRVVEFPLMTDEELKEAVKWDIEKYVPYEPDAYYYDYHVIGAGKTVTQLKILLIATPKQLVDRLAVICREAGITLLAVEIEPMALARTISFGLNQSIVVDIGAKYSQIIVFQQDIPVAVRVISMGGNEFTKSIASTLNLEWNEAEQYKRRQSDLFVPAQKDVQGMSDLQRQMQMIVTELTTEVRRTIDFYQSQNERVSMDNFIFTGGGSMLGNLLPSMEVQLGTNIALHSPLASVKRSRVFEENYLQENSLRFAVAIGLALRGGGA